jgi:hypothetical protein
MREMGGLFLIMSDKVPYIITLRTTTCEINVSTRRQLVPWVHRYIYPLLVTSSSAHLAQAPTKKFE